VPFVIVFNIAELPAAVARRNSITPTARPGRSGIAGAGRRRYAFVAHVLFERDRMMVGLPPD
jgi:hypothetical protein